MHAEAPHAFLPVAMSLAALADVLIHLALHGTAPHVGEGAAAHIWQLLMAVHTRIVLLSAIMWVPRSPGRAVLILALQVGAAMTAIAPVFLLGWWRTPPGSVNPAHDRAVASRGGPLTPAPHRTPCRIQICAIIDWKGGGRHFTR